MENELNEDPLTILEARHRKEKKELQAQIQALKKAAKNDKTKKKELAAEIIKLETDLDLKQQIELNVSEPPPENSQDNEQTEDITENDCVKPKISKAQKRREKKHQQDKEREEQIKLQEKENLYGPRNKEIQAITAKLKERRLKILSIPSDGDCLYKAVSHQLTVKKYQPLSVGDLRSRVAAYIRENRDEFMPFMSNPDTCNMLSEAEFEEYCDKIRDTKVWGGQLEIRALSNLLKCPINVIQATGPAIIEQGSEFEGPPLLISYHRHMYQLGEHYNSTLPNDAEEE